MGIHCQDEWEQEVSIHGTYNIVYYSKIIIIVWSNGNQ